MTSVDGPAAALERLAVLLEKEDCSDTRDEDSGGLVRSDDSEDTSDEDSSEEEEDVTEEDMSEDHSEVKTKCEVCAARDMHDQANVKPGPDRIKKHGVFGTLAIVRQLV